MSKHTPGPWHVDPKAPEESFFEDVNVLRHDGLAVAVCVHNGDILPPEPLANAHLVAAAPDMLAALKLLNQWFEITGSSVRARWERISPEDRAAIVSATKAAIAKAEGRS